MRRLQKSGAPLLHGGRFPALRHFPFMRNTLKYGIINMHHQGVLIYM